MVASLKTELLFDKGTIGRNGISSNLPLTMTAETKDFYSNHHRMGDSGNRGAVWQTGAVSGRR
jgi:hypothetical protein